MKTYYTVEVKENGKWLPQFGDFDLSVVKEEEEDIKESFNLDGTKAKTRIVTTQES